ncbi:MAG TPA: hypothetical protein VGK50_06075 [Coriobacteriia bacterium]|jgi:hypothetical protein
MSEGSVGIDLSKLHCADCLATLSDVVLPKMPGVLRTEVRGGELLVTIDEEVLTEGNLLGRLTGAGLLR